MKTLLSAIFVTWLLACLPLHAAEEDSADTGQPTAGENEDAAETGTVEPMPDIGLIEEAQEREENEDFVPSIRITEDLPVAFPADI